MTTWIRARSQDLLQEVQECAILLCHARPPAVQRAEGQVIRHHSGKMRCRRPAATSGCACHKGSTAMPADPIVSRSRTSTSGTTIENEGLIAM